MKGTIFNTPPICIAAWLPFFYMAVRLLFVSRCSGESICGWGHWDVPSPLLLQPRLIDSIEMQRHFNWTLVALPDLGPWRRFALRP